MKVDGNSGGWGPGKDTKKPGSPNQGAGLGGKEEAKNQLLVWGGFDWGAQYDEGRHDDSFEESPE